MQARKIINLSAFQTKIDYVQIIHYIEYNILLEVVITLLIHKSTDHNQKISSNLVPTISITIVSMLMLKSISLF